MKSFFGSCDFTTFEKKEGRKTEFSDLNNIRRKTITTKNNNKKKERKKERKAGDFEHDSQKMSRRMAV